ncbi:DUF2971 domain-containing protein [Escherichia coli]|uniref:DUF2971 domain-containing protein n=1 Tax=Escherichia coli TaxID=562 RepID=UPI0011CE8B43|nr:DUF2971 domain-containing protein [Escherichia coli]HEB1499824.1 DUF2971 domain-containing protein [Escherichia albertii]EHY1692756.1 DUF2971 domain-containing protein [Escherichia coli]EIO1065265.1 DUF2971 domain-containing protein [Escherichia coli]EJD8302570.1 DUF2971 domain-containing protein [Escherichia coli]EKE9912364.1 DUF2971 domain-containing protein [Escherichia coli]
MILYKYIDKTSLERFFKDGYISIKFTPYSEFNDPFESYGYELSLDSESLEPLAMRGEINQNVACLCLSKNPLNVLMWSHYADKHQGFVVAIDTERAGFDDEEKCLITAQKGDINYLESRIKSKLKISQENIYSTDVISKLLLTKSLHWKYEEEVRIIKRVGLLQKQENILIDKITDLSSVTAIYIGINNKDIDKIIKKSSVLEGLVLNKTVRLYQCEFKKSTWDLTIEDYEYTESPHAMQRGGFESLEKIVRAIERNHIGD